MKNFISLMQNYLNGTEVDCHIPLLQPDLPPPDFNSATILTYTDVLDPILPEPQEVPNLRELSIKYKNPLHLMLGLTLPAYTQLRTLIIYQDQLDSEPLCIQLKLGVELPHLERLILTGVTIVTFPRAPQLHSMSHLGSVIVAGQTPPPIISRR